MIPEITQKNVHIFIPYKVSKISGQIAKNENLPIAKAVAKFYRSNIAKLLEDESTKLWHDGWVGIYDLYKNENEKEQQTK